MDISSIATLMKYMPSVQPLQAATANIILGLYDNDAQEKEQNSRAAELVAEASLAPETILGGHIDLWA